MATYCVSPASQRRRMSVKGVGSRRDAPEADMLRKKPRWRDVAATPQGVK
jgi:hypothetical protein